MPSFSRKMKISYGDDYKSGQPPQHDIFPFVDFLSVMEVEVAQAPADEAQDACTDETAEESEDDIIFEFNAQESAEGADGHAGDDRDRSNEKNHEFVGVMGAEFFFGAVKVVPGKAEPFTPSLKNRFAAPVGEAVDKEGADGHAGGGGDADGEEEFEEVVGGDGQFVHE